MLNLLMNALEAIGDDPSNARLIDVAPAPSMARPCTMEVRDTGPGVPSIATRVFDAFYTTKPSGMGMGLPIARSIVEAHGGTIHVANNATGGGATARRPPAAGPGGPGVMAETPTVFVVDDDRVGAAKPGATAEGVRASARRHSPARASFSRVTRSTGPALSDPGRPDARAVGVRSLRAAEGGGPAICRSSSSPDTGMSR